MWRRRCCGSGCRFKPLYLAYSGAYRRVRGGFPGNFKIQVLFVIVFFCLGPVPHPGRARVVRLRPGYRAFKPSVRIYGRGNINDPYGFNHHRRFALAIRHKAGSSPGFFRRTGRSSRSIFTGHTLCRNRFSLYYPNHNGCAGSSSHKSQLAVWLLVFACLRAWEKFPFPLLLAGTFTGMLKSFARSQPFLQGLQKFSALVLIGLGIYFIIL